MEEDLKYELFKEDEKQIYYRIRALKDFGKGLFKVKKGEIGGIVSDENVLSQEGNCWIKYESCAIKSIIKDNAFIFDTSQIINSTIKDNVQVHNNSRVINSELNDDVQLYGNSKVVNNCKLFGTIVATNNTVIIDHVEIKSKRFILKDNAYIQGPIKINQDNITINDNILENIKSMLLVRYGKPNKNNNYKVYKLVKSTNKENVYTSIYDDKFVYDISKSNIIKEINYNIHKYSLCNNGIHVSFKDDYDWGNIAKSADKIFTCFVNVDDIIAIDFDNYNNCKIRVNKIKVQNVRNFPILNKRDSMKIVHKLNTKNILPVIYNNKTFETFDFFKAISITKNTLYLKLDINVTDSIDNYSVILLGPQKSKNISMVAPPRFYKCNIIGNHDNVYQINHKLDSKNIITIVYDYKTKKDVTLHTMNVFENNNISILKFDKILENDNEYRVLLIKPSPPSSKTGKLNSEKGIANTTPYYNLYTFNGIDCFENEDISEYSITIHHTLATYDIYGSLIDVETSEILHQSTYSFIRIDENNVKIDFLKMPEKGHRYTLFLTRC